MTKIREGSNIVIEGERLSSVLKRFSRKLLEPCKEIIVVSPGKFLEFLQKYTKKIPKQELLLMASIGTGGWFGARNTKGYVILKSNGKITKYTIAHELGHGLFRYNSKIRKLFLDAINGVGDIDDEEMFADIVGSYYFKPSRWKLYVKGKGSQIVKSFLGK